MAEVVKLEDDGPGQLTGEGVLEIDLEADEPLWVVGVLEDVGPAAVGVGGPLERGGGVRLLRPAGRGAREKEAGSEAGQHAAGQPTFGQSGWALLSAPRGARR